MTTQTQPRPAAPRPAVQKRSGPRIAAIVAGALLALAGTGLAAAGTGLFATFGSDGTVNSGRHSLSTSSTALVSEAADIEDTAHVADVVGKPRIRLSVHATAPTSGVFVGVGPAKQVERYLASASYAEVTDIDLDPFDLDRRAHRGSKRPARPASQGFWVAKATGRDAATLRWKVRDGDYRVVLMNADGSRRVHADGDVGLTLPHMATIAWSLVGGGLLLMAGGATAIALGARRRPVA
jgi:hypothetical protein